MRMTSAIRSSLATALLILSSNLAYAAQANGQVGEQGVLAMVLNTEIRSLSTNSHTNRPEECHSGYGSKPKSLKRRDFGLFAIRYTNPVSMWFVVSSLSLRKYGPILRQSQSSSALSHTRLCAI